MNRKGNFVAKPENPIPLLRWPIPNLWLGVSVEDQQRADERIPLLLQTPAAVRFLSVEPQLEAVNLEAFLRCNCGLDPKNDQFAPPWGHAANCPYRARISWVICGGESGPGARPLFIQWAEELRDQCKTDGVPFFMKQLGSHHKTWFDGSKDRQITGKGGDPTEWPENIRVREFPR